MRISVLWRIVAAAAILALPFGAASAETLDRTGLQSGPALEWTLTNPGFEGNPFDVEAHVTFTHAKSGEVRQTGMCVVHCGSG